MNNKLKILLLTGLLLTGVNLPVKAINVYNPNIIYRTPIINPDKEVKQEVFLFVDGYGKMSLEEIVYNGLIAEMGYPSFDIEAYKAQAVALRTFALSNKKHKGEEFDLCGTTCCFAMADDKKKAGFTQKQLDRFRQAVEETEGEILTYDGNIITTPVFFAYAHNTTNSADDVWSGGKPYLKSVNTPEKVEPQVVEYTQEEFCKRLDIENLQQFNIINKNFSGYNKEVQVGNKIENGNQLRGDLGLKSGNFDIYLLDNGNIKVVCYGYGHGVGMSQYGANELAKQGYDYKDILKHYYQGVEVVKK